MPIKHSFSILLCNFKLVAKIFFFILIILLVAGALLIGILKPVLDGFFTTIQEQYPLDANEFIQHPILTMQGIIRHFLDFLTSNSSMILLRILYVWLLIMGSRFLLSLPLLPTAKILHSKMTTGFDMGLVNATVLTIGQNLLFSLLTSIVFSVLDILIFVALWYILVGLFGLISVLALPVVLLLALLIYSLRVSILCQWIPEICACPSKNIFIAFKNALAPGIKNLRKNFICTFVLIIASVTTILTTLIPTMGLIPLLLIPTIMVMYGAMCLALNFSFHQQKYFTDNGVTVYNPVKKFD